jgi:hypothetical protein
MDYIPPINGDQGDPDRPYVNGDPATGTEGSIPPADVFNHVQAEILAVLAAGGITPDAGDLTQLDQAIDALIAAAVPAGDYLPKDGSEAMTGLLNPAQGILSKRYKIVTANTLLAATDSGSIVEVQSGATAITTPNAGGLSDGWNVTVASQTGNDVVVSAQNGTDTFQTLDGAVAGANFTIPGNLSLYGEVWTFVRRPGNTWLVLPVRRRAKQRVLQMLHTSISPASYSGGPWQSTGLAMGFTRLNPNSYFLAWAHGVVGFQDSGSKNGMLFDIATNTGGADAQQGYGAAMSSGGTSFIRNVSNFALSKKITANLPAAGAGDTMTLFAGNENGNAFHLGRPHTQDTTSAPSTSYTGVQTQMHLWEVIDE